MAVGSDLIELDGVLGDHEVHVWHIDLTAQEAAVDRLLPLLAKDELSRAARFLVPEPRIQFIVSRALLRIALGRYVQVAPGEVRFRTTRAWQA